MRSILYCLFFILTMDVVANQAEAPQPSVSKENVAVELNVEKWTLPNGLTVLFHVDHSAPLVSYHQWFRVGSKDELVGQTGLAHFFEHLMFKGSQNYPSETFSRVLSAKGANYNASTSNDFTNYYIDAPTDQLEYVIKVEADRMRRLNFDEKEIQSEREVVKEERRMRYDNSPDGFLRLTLPELMYTKSPYRWPPIGSMEDLNRATLADFKNFYNRFYAPNNAVVVVAGHFDPAQAKAWITKAYGGFAAQTIDRPKYEAEPEQKTARTKVIKWKVQNPIVTVAYPTVGIDHKDNFALEILGMILGDGDASRLHKKMVYEDQKAISVGVSNYPQMLTGRFMFTATLKEKTKAETAKQMIQSEITKVMKNGVGLKELEKAKNQILSQQVESLQRISDRGRSLAFHEVVLGDYRRLFTDLDSYLKVTNEDIMRVTKTYLQPNRSNMVQVQPE